MEITEYFEQILETKKQKNISFLFLAPRKYEKQCKKFGREFGGITNTSYKDTMAMTFFSRKEGRYYIVVKDIGTHQHSCLSYLYIFLHEVGHAETLSSKELGRYEKQEKVVEGYEFWKEYIAEYLAVKFWQEHFSTFPAYDSLTKTKNYITVRESDYDSLYELVVCCEITGYIPDIFKEDLNELIFLLKQIKENHKEDLKQITIQEFKSLGKTLIRIKNKQKTINEERSNL